MDDTRKQTRKQTNKQAQRNATIETVQMVRIFQGMVISNFHLVMDGFLASTGKMNSNLT